MASVLTSIGSVMEQYRDRLQEYLESMTPVETAGMVLVGFGIIGIVAGTLMALDDAHDIGKTVYPGHPSPLHHWMYGVIIAVLSAICLAVGVALIIYERINKINRGGNK